MSIYHPVLCVDYINGILSVDDDDADLSIKDIIDVLKNIDRVEQI